MTSDAIPVRVRWYQRFAPKRAATRRRVVVAFGISIGACAAAGALPDAPFLTLAAILAALGLGVAARLSIDSAADLPDDQLDERLVRERDDAYLASYRLIATIFVVAVIGMGMLRDVSGDAGPVLDALWAATPPLVLFTPSAVLAWRRRDV
jgi:hypothetical protein